jgi:hypothetical protein
MTMNRCMLTISCPPAALALLLLAACGPIPSPDDARDAGAGDAITETVVCKYNGATYEAGAQFPISGGCGICSCDAEQGVVCVEGHCTDGGDPYFCMYHGQISRPGDAFPSGDGCSTCYCTDDYRVVCPPVVCADAGQDAGPGCTYNGQHYDEGEYFEAEDHCNGCSCSYGQVLCTACACFDGGMPGEDGGAVNKCGMW